jgi:hypothetical protein
VVSGSVQAQGKRENPESTEYYDRRDEPQTGAQLFSLPLWPHHTKSWFHISAAACRTKVGAFTTTADIQLINPE